MVVGIELEVWKEGDGMVRARLRCSIWILAVLRRLLHIVSMRGVQPCTGGGNVPIWLRVYSAIGSLLRKLRSSGGGKESA